jgi:hypothetical protein
LVVDSLVVLLVLASLELEPIDSIGEQQLEVFA